MAKNGGHDATLRQPGGGRLAFLLVFGKAGSVAGRQYLCPRVRRGSQSQDFCVRFVRPSLSPPKRLRCSQIVLPSRLLVHSSPCGHLSERLFFSASVPDARLPQ